MILPEVLISRSSMAGKVKFAKGPEVNEGLGTLEPCRAAMGELGFEPKEGARGRKRVSETAVLLRRPSVRHIRGEG